MNAQQTDLARKIFNRIAGRSQDAVFLYTPESQPMLLTFGQNRVDKADYFIHLRCDHSEVKISSEDPQQFVLLMDSVKRFDQETRRVRLVLYTEDDPLPKIEFDSDQPDEKLEGEIVIQARDESGLHYATIYANFYSQDSGKTGAYMMIDNSKGLFDHFSKYRGAVWGPLLN
ncbi:hypothetical protein AALB19_15690 [Oscillospiraceae bacterium 50-58]|jgi:hypothetical protein